MASSLALRVFFRIHFVVTRLATLRSTGSSDRQLPINAGSSLLLPMQFLSPHHTAGPVSVPPPTPAPRWQCRESSKVVCGLHHLDNRKTPLIAALPMISFPSRTNPCAGFLCVYVCVVLQYSNTAMAWDISVFDKCSV